MSERTWHGRALLVAVAVMLVALSGAHFHTGANLGPPPGDGPAPPGVVPAASASRVVHSQVIGYSSQHRAIVAYELGDPHAAFTALVLGSMHGYYERAGETVTRALRTMTIPTGMHLWVIDTINPDGDALHQRGNANGVDLNRNWPYSWTPISRAGCTAFVCHYSGPHALSEPESIALTTFLNKVKPKRIVSIHQPLDGIDTTDGGSRDPAFRDALARGLNLPLKALTCFGGCHGTLTGWLTHSTTLTGITVEFPQSVTSQYLSGPAPRAILAALMTGVRVPAPPAISRVVGLSGATGSTTTPHRVTIHGTGFSGVTKVTFGRVAGSAIRWLSSTTLTVLAPKHTAGPVTVHVTGTYGTSTTLTAARYTFVSPPSITAVGPRSGGTTSRGTVTITGSGFIGVTRVTFGRVGTTAIRRLSTTKLTVVTPLHTAGPVTVHVSGTYGTSTTIAAARYTFVSAH